MILADKIMQLRKQHGMSQEDLANELSISRQSVSKWESGASIPDLDKIIKLSSLFGVSTDYLLKEELEVVTPSEAPDIAESNNGSENVKSITIEEANGFMNITAKAAGNIGLGVILCILSPACLILFGGLTEYTRLNVNENLLSALGMVVLFIMITVAVSLFIIYGMQLDKFAYLERERISLQYGVKGIVEKKKEIYEPKFRMNMVIGVVLCIVGVIPIIVVGCLELEDMWAIICVDILLGFVSVATYFFVTSGMIYAGYQKLLQEGDYTESRKRVNEKLDMLSGAYWCTVTAIFLGISFTTERWDLTWLIWAVAGVLFAAFYCIIHAVAKEK